MKVGDREVKRPHPADQASYAVEDRWILSRLEWLEGEVDALMSRYELGAAVSEVHDFLWGDFCDWYIEFAKVRLNDGDERPLRVLVHVLDHGLRLLHPFMPFVTEELWQTLREHIDDDMANALIVAWFPKPAANWHDERAEAEMAHVIEVNRAIRNIRAEKKLELSFRPKAFLRTDEFGHALQAVAAATAFTSRVEPIVTGAGDALPEGEFAFARVGDTEIAVSLPQVDAAEERARLEKDLAETAAYVDRLTKQLANDSFRAKAPANVIAGVEANLAEAAAKTAGLRERIAAL
jgi:valyl-tRNA synthetase